MTSTHDLHAPDGPGQRGVTGSGFGGDFLRGVAVSGYQSEGDGVHSDTWYLEHSTPTVFQQKSGRSINSWELGETDLDLAARLHLNAYRFSVEWSRVEPADGELDVAALDHYEAVVDGCHARGLAPVVTFDHFTNPHWFARDGGWLTGGSERRFADHCDAVMRLGDRIHRPSP